MTFSIQFCGITVLREIPQTCETTILPGPKCVFQISDGLFSKQKQITYEDLCIYFSSILTTPKKFGLKIAQKSQNILKMKSCKENTNLNNRAPVLIENITRSCLFFEEVNRNNGKLYANPISDKIIEMLENTNFIVNVSTNSYKIRFTTSSKNLTVKKAKLKSLNVKITAVYNAQINSELANY
ncbi:hypothetical protein AGLY_002248 [Aphis glycines]|uniref:Uncharacterized protein n=1 Tax=Aphis glycines TaxID=307491 RepID=A0A6G0U2V4_APHGL|nr:hypothetical protein AGLY_002248 [Aphis glycines]